MKEESVKIGSLISAYGAEKSTTLNTISGLIQPTSDEITHKNKRINKVSTRDIIASGISQLPDGRRIFSGMTVKKNLNMSAFLRNDPWVYIIWRRATNVSDRTSFISNPELLLLDGPLVGLAPLFIDDVQLAYLGG